ncbi:ATP-binding protein [Streptomyces sp. PAM3C]|nr:ATP-binding protein [Streptomyces sp. PAM3C]
MRLRFWKFRKAETSSAAASPDVAVEVRDTGDASASQGGSALSGYQGATDRNGGPVTVVGTGHATATHGGVAISGGVSELHLHSTAPDAASRLAQAHLLMARLDAVWRGHVRTAIGGYNGDQPQHLVRQTARDALLAAIGETSGALIVHGVSGTGKSALVIDAVTLGRHASQGLNLRHMPSGFLDFEQRLGMRLDQALAAMDPQPSLLIVDGADAAAETHTEALFYLLEAAKSAAISVVLITSDVALGAVRDATRRTVASVSEYEVSGLDDEEVKAIAAAFPRMRRLIDNVQARELLRRPAVSDLLVRAGGSGVPLTDADAMREVWHGLVRRNEDSSNGQPGARERVLRLLARQQLDEQSAEEVADQLDDAAVAGLRRDGLLRPALELPWQSLPVFSHDLLRTYAMAYVLLADAEPGTRLGTSRAPRWALPAARLACQALLTASADASGAVLPQRFASLHQQFQALAAEGFGERWADVPSEALLTAGRDASSWKAAWRDITQADPDLVGRLLRLLNQRHRRDGILDPMAASPVVACLLDDGLTSHFSEAVLEMIRDWQLGLIAVDTPAGHALRLQLRGQLVARCREAAERLAQQEREREARLAARTPEQVAADEERAQEFRIFGPPSLARRRRRRQRRQLPRELTDATMLEQLALLGPDIGNDGERLLLEVADHRPHYLAPALEEIGTGRALAAYSPELLRRLVMAYYIEDTDDEGDYFAADLLDDGIRGHEGRRVPVAPLAAYYRGPFLPMLQAGFREGVAVINTMLNAAARHRVKKLTSRRYGSGSDREAEGYSVALTLDNAERRYIGDGQVYLWYRSTGVGPYPCKSALQALELVCDRYIEGGAPPAVLASILLESCENLAMVGLIVGMLIRHVDATDTALDDFLSEPELWHLEFSRATSEHVGLAAVTPGISHVERRKWNLRDAAMMLALYAADADRQERLRQIGQLLEARARQQFDQLRSAVGSAEEMTEFDEAAATGMAVVRGWASCLDRSRYSFERGPDGTVLAQAEPPDDVITQLRPDNEDIARANQALALSNRYGIQRHSTASGPVSAGELTRDLAVARDLQTNPPRNNASDPAQAPADVAAYALQAALLHGEELPPDDVAWAATTLLDIAETIQHTADDESFFPWGVDRSAARGLPLLLLPQAADVRHTLELDTEAGKRRLNDGLHDLGCASTLETRIYFAASLDPLWAAPCVPDACHHHSAFEILQDSARHSAIGPWSQDGQRRDIRRLDGNLTQDLTSLPGDEILVPQLSPAIRGLAPAAITGCCAGEALPLLTVLLEAHRRGLASLEHQYHHSNSDALIAARALLTIAGADSATIGRHLAAYADNAGALAEALQALAAAAEENEQLAGTARQIWPQVMDHVLDLFDAGHKPDIHNFFGAQAVAALVPAPAYENSYLYRELGGKPCAWIALPSWAVQMDRWLQYGTGVPACVDALVAALRTLSVDDQIRCGLPWLERLVSRNSDEIARQSYLLPGWLRDVHSVVKGTTAQQWQRIVDVLTVAGDSRLSDLVD